MLNVTLGFFVFFIAIAFVYLIVELCQLLEKQLDNKKEGKDK